TALTELQTEVAGKASADAVAALESRTSATETAVKTGSAATTSLRASLLPLASEVLDQGFAEFLARRKARKAMVAADQSLTAQIRAVDDRLILTADAVTRLELDLPKLASATAVDALRLRVTTAEGRITSQGEAITALNTALPGKASASALEALTSRVTLTEGGIVSLGQSVTDLGTAVAGKAGTDVVAALESRTSATETAVKTGGAATTSLRASLLPLASEVLDQGFAEFLARRKVRKAVAEADQSLTAQIRAVDDRLILTADAVTRLELDLPKLASATAVDALRLRVTTAEGRITSQGEAITALNTALPGKASASAL
ncbi:hypothetical protein, partial [Gemmobacter nanjingensis]|uniref:hypothetical protein n=1 Tax=Gemmobacter nanjingensis TaxID=488454 RepID=UPI001E548714